MPLYSYHCAKCDKEVELLVSASETPVCPACGGKKLERLMSRTVAEGRNKAYAKKMRAAAAREGHTSNFGSSSSGRRR